MVYCWDWARVLMRGCQLDGRKKAPWIMRIAVGFWLDILIKSPGYCLW
jgi:hypothetical protein